MATALRGAPARTIRAEDISFARRVTAFCFVLVFDFFYGWAWNTVDLLRPDLIDAFGLSLTQASLTYTAQSAGALIGAVVIGQLADRFGRRNLLFVVMIGYSVSLASGAICTGLTELLVHRFATGVFLGGVFPIGVSTYTALFDRNQCGKLAGFYNGTFNGSIVVIGFVVSGFGTEWRELLLIGAAIPICLAPLAFVLVPNDRTTIPYGITDVPPPPRKLPAAELFSPALRRRTLLIALMVGLNFFAYQAFAGWQATYLEKQLGLAKEVSKGLIGWQFTATIIGGFFWGWVADRYGRRANALGFVLAVALIALYLLSADTYSELLVIGFLFGLMLPASVVWGPWLAELFPAHLRSTATSIFNWGRIISLFSPPITAAVANGVSLGAAMALGGVAWFLSAIVWRLLPETLERRTAQV